MAISEFKMRFEWKFYIVTAPIYMCPTVLRGRFFCLQIDYKHT